MDKADSFYAATYGQPIAPQEFETAIRAGQLSLHYQPIIELTSGAVAGFEALMRWTHPTRGAIPPGVFIPVAESSGLIVEAGRWALREACRALRRIESRAHSDHPLFMSVNFSPVDFAEENFLDELYMILSETDILPSKICLEISEALIALQPGQARETLALCRTAGLGIALDDYGTMATVPHYLENYSIDALKIDRTLIRDMLGDPDARSTVESLLQAARGQGQITIAEGIESEDQAAFLKDSGCNLAQGFHFSKPLAEADAIDTLLSWREGAAGGRFIPQPALSSSSFAGAMQA